MDTPERSTTIFRKSPEPALSPVFVSPLSPIDSAIGDASALAGAAASPLLDAADDLSEAARRFEVVAVLAQEQIDTLVDQLEYALEQADANYAAAAGIRRVLGAEQVTV